MNLELVEQEAAQSSGPDAEEDWLREAERRAKTLDSGAVAPVSAEQVREKARALLR